MMFVYPPFFKRSCEKWSTAHGQQTSTGIDRPSPPNMNSIGRDFLAFAEQSGYRNMAKLHLGINTYSVITTMNDMKFGQVAVKNKSKYSPEITVYASSVWVCFLLSIGKCPMIFGNAVLLTKMPFCWKILGFHCSKLSGGQPKMYQRLCCWGVSRW